MEEYFETREALAAEAADFLLSSPSRNTSTQRTKIKAFQYVAAHYFAASLTSSLPQVNFESMLPLFCLGRKSTKN